MFHLLICGTPPKAEICVGAWGCSESWFARRTEEEEEEEEGDGVWMDRQVRFERLEVLYRTWSRSGEDEVPT